MRPLLFAIIGLALATAPAVAFAQERADPATKCGALPGPVLTGDAAAIDGDTLALIVDGRRTRNIRLHGFDAPEMRGPSKDDLPNGIRARAVMQDLIYSKPVTCRVVEWDNAQYCRIVATCTAGGVDLSIAMLAAGMAKVFDHYAFRPDMLDRYKALLAAEREAREKRVGLWQVWLKP